MMTTASYRDDHISVRDVVAGYAKLVADRVDEGWHPHLATLMFAPLPGKPESVIAQMRAEAERVYRIFLPRVVRRPLASGSAGRLPILIAAPDGPVGKRDKPLASISINNGVHLHGVLLVPPSSRLPVPVHEHFRHQQALYVRDGRRVLRVDVRPVDRDLERVVAYALKGLSRRRFALDDLIVLPRTASEVRHDRRPRAR